MPSRFQSFFAFENLEEARKFRSEHSQNNSIIYVLEGQKHVKLDMSLLKIGYNEAVGILLAQNIGSENKVKRRLGNIIIAPNKNNKGN